MPIQTNHAAGHYALDVDGAPVDALKAISGMDMLADVVVSALGPGAIQKKHVSNISWTPARAVIGMGMGKGMYEWMKASFEHGATHAGGTLAAADFNFKQRSLLTFYQAQLTAITVPRLDGSSKEAGAFEVEFAAEQVRVAKGDGSDIRHTIATKQQPWLCSNFRFELGALPCARVASIESFTWLCTPASAANVFQPVPGPTITVPDLRLSISAADYDAWAQAAQHWFVDGHHGEADEMNGLIILLTPDLQTPLGAITLSNVGFKRFSQLPPSAGGDALYRFTVDLYVERLALRLLQYEG
jgi:hypothetical protein